MKRSLQQADAKSTTIRLEGPNDVSDTTLVILRSSSSCGNKVSQALEQFRITRDSRFADLAEENARGSIFRLLFAQNQFVYYKFIWPGSRRFFFRKAGSVGSESS